MITEINLKTGAKKTRDWSQHEIEKHESAIELDAKNKKQLEIEAELRALDLKSIRAIREGDEIRIKALEDEAEILRQKLRGL